MRALAAAALLAALAAPAAADRIERGVVVRLEGDSIYIDVPVGRGAAAGRPMRLKRRIELRHPGTGRPVIDELPVGGAPLPLTDAGAYLSRVVAPADLIAQVHVGDIAEVLVLEAAPARPPAEPVHSPATQLAEDKAAVLRLWKATAGRPLGERLTAWQKFLAEHPDSPHAPLLQAELDLLRAAQQGLVEAGRDAGELLSPRVAGIEHASPPAAPAGQPLALAFLITPDIRAAWLHYRPRGGDTFRKLPLRSDGDAYLRGAIPADAVQAPGVDYFVEAVDSGGQGGAAVATAQEPIEVRVDPPPPARWFDRPEKRSRVTTSATYLDYATFDDRPGDHTDRYWLVETDFLYRVDAGILHGIRSGFGVLQGEGGRIAAPGPGESPRRAGFTYGYVEAELHPETLPAALLARLVSGLGEDGLGFGVEGRVRLGAERGTNVSFGASTLEDVGFLSEIRMQFVAVPRFPVGLAVAVTDQPNQGDLGVRGSIDLGWQALSWVSPMIRLSYQGRTVRHSGVGGGLSLVFDW